MSGESGIAVFATPFGDGGLNLRPLRAAESGVEDLNHLLCCTRRGLGSDQSFDVCGIELVVGAHALRVQSDQIEADFCHLGIAAIGQTVLHLTVGRSAPFDSELHAPKMVSGYVERCVVRAAGRGSALCRRRTPSQTDSEFMKLPGVHNSCGRPQDPNPPAAIGGRDARPTACEGILFAQDLIQVAGNRDVDNHVVVFNFRVRLYRDRPALNRRVHFFGESDCRIKVGQQAPRLAIPFHVLGNRNWKSDGTRHANTQANAALPRRCRNYKIQHRRPQRFQAGNRNASFPVFPPAYNLFRAMSSRKRYSRHGRNGV